MTRCLLILILSLIFVAPTHGQIHQAFQPDPAEIERAACAAEMARVLMAVVKNNLSQTDKISSVTDDDLADGGILRGRGYLQARMGKPTSRCSYSSEGDLTSSGTIRCSVHGISWLQTKTSESQALMKKIDLALLAGANINEQDASGKTPVHVAVEKRDASLLRYLTSKGARLDLKDSSGKTPFERACDHGDLDSIDILCRLLPGVSRPSYASDLVMPGLPTRTALPFSMRDDASFWNDLKKTLDSGNETMRTLKLFLGSPLFTASGVPEETQKKIRDFQTTLEATIPLLEGDFQSYWSEKSQTPEQFSGVQKHLEEIRTAMIHLAATIETDIERDANPGRLSSLFLKTLLESLQEAGSLPANPDQQFHAFLAAPVSENELKASISSRLRSLPELIARQQNLLRLGSLFTGDEGFLNFPASAIDELKDGLQQGKSIQQRLLQIHDRLSAPQPFTPEEINAFNDRRGLLYAEGIRLDFRLARILTPPMASLGFPDVASANQVIYLIYGGKFQEAAALIRKHVPQARSTK